MTYIDFIAEVGYSLCTATDSRPASPKGHYMAKQSKTTDDPDFQRRTVLAMVDEMALAKEHQARADVLFKALAKSMGIAT
jgi:hypothetical protein